MHEFSIVQNIMDIAAESVKKHDVRQVYAVEVEVGRASGVVREAMEFAWNAGIKGTVLENAVLKIHEIPLEVRCMVCGKLYNPSEIYEICPGCGDVSPEVITGKELRVVAIEC